MKRLLIGILGLSVCAAGIVYLTSCAAQKGPLSPSAGLIGPSSPGAKSWVPYWVTNSFTGGNPMAVSRTVDLQFDTALNPATINTSTVMVWTMNDNGLDETPYSFYRVGWDAATKKIRVTPDPGHNSGFWDDNKVYRILYTAGITDFSGTPIGGNRDQIVEGSPWDDVTFQFSTGAPVAPGYQYLNTPGGGMPHLSLSGINVRDGLGVNHNITNANVSNVPLPITVTVTFGDVVDQSTVWTDGTHLHRNISFQDSNGQAVAPYSVTRTTTTIVAFFSNLANAKQYSLQLYGGLNGIRSTQDPWITLKRGVYFDGNGNGRANASDNLTYPRLIYTQNADGTTTAPPTVATADVNYFTSDRHWEIVFTVPSGNGKMDASTLTPANVQMVAGSNNSSFGNTEIKYVIQPQEMAYDVTTNKLSIYVPDKFLTNLNDGNPFCYVKIYISHSVKSADGLGFDGNNDGVGGQANDNALYGDNGSGGVAVKIRPLF